MGQALHMPNRPAPIQNATKPVLTLGGHAAVLAHLLVDSGGGVESLGCADRTRSKTKLADLRRRRKGLQTT